ncbi:endolytic transglycosylase MltG [Pseudarthrobacter oxydans]|uniref:endolytic transglycosylase MltG n=1 Tax=Pseudarthrobacter oxydans TaxID=1671 RepID=UPI003ECCF812
MSPANIDDSSSPLDPGAGRPLTRKELRAREKTLNTGGHDAVPEQAYETGHDIPPLPAEPPAAAEADPRRQDEALREDQAPQDRVEEPVIPAAPAAPPSIQDDRQEPAQHDSWEPALAGHQHAAGVHYSDEPHYEEPGYADGHDGTHYEEGHDDGAHHHELLPASAAATVVAKPSKKVRRRRRLLALFLTLAVFVTAVAVGAQFLKPLLGSDKPGDFPGPGSGEVVVTVENGEGTRSVASKLENEGVVANADTFLQSFSASGGILSPGDYTFKSEMKNSDAVNVLLGKDQTKVIYFALSAGLRIGESLQAISQGSGISFQDLQALSNEPAQFGLPANAKNLEGYLAPGEHRFPLGTPAKDILQSLVKITTDELVSQGITDPAKQYEAVIVASIVQAEGGQAEYGDVAGAIYNRLKPNDQTGGFLQVDSAVTYGLGTKSYNFTDEQRQDKSNPYNTYANPGLPPGPIGSPGKTAIDAAARPKTNDYLYWVTINLDTKETKFSRTLAEHNAYVEQYNAWCTANVGRCT